MSSSGHSADGRKTSHRFFRNKDDDISDREVFKNELEAGILVGCKVRQSVGLLEIRFIFYFLDTRFWYYKKYSFAIFSGLYSDKALC